MDSKTSRRTFIKVCATALVGAAAAACGATPTATPAPTATKPAAVAPTGAPATAPTATSAPKPTAVPTAAKPKLQKLNLMSFTALPAPTPRAENQYLQYIEKTLGIQLDFNWVPSADATAKLNTTLASGDIPDCIGCLANWTATVVQAAQAGAFLKLESIGLPKDTRGLPGLAVIKQLTWDNSAVNGVHYATVNQGVQFGICNVMRKDWLDKLGMTVPQTTTELKTVLEAFAKKDPDGNGKADSVGWGVGQGRPWAQGGWHLFYWPFGVPYKYGLDKAGKMTHADITDQMRAAVTFARDVYQTGAMNADFPSQPFATVRDEFAAGRVGGILGAIAAIYDSPQYGAALRKVVPTADLVAPDPMKAEGYQRVTYFQPGFNYLTLINGKYAKDTDAAWEIMKVISFWQDPANETLIQYGLKDVHHTVDAKGNIVTTDKGTADIQWMRSWGPRITETYQTANYVAADTMKNKIMPDTDRLVKFSIPDVSWGLWPDLGADNPEVELDKFATTTLEQMVQGKKPLSEWDAYVAEWKKRGGDRLLNGWNDAKQKAGR
jgi:putative aldouronate transport system substrate-binding protein